MLMIIVYNSLKTYYMLIEFLVLVLILSLLLSVDPSNLTKCILEFLKKLIKTSFTSFTLFDEHPCSKNIPEAVLKLSVP